jgi:hypothetical protein
MKTYFLLFSSLSIASAQLVSFGVNAGFPIGDPTYGRNESKPFLVGPVVEFRPLQHLGIEVDAIYSQSSYTTTFLGLASVGSGFSYQQLASGGSSFSYHQQGNTWQFPVLGKYYFRPQTARWQPFAALGFSLRTTGYDIQGANFFIQSGEGTVSIHQVDSHYRTDLGVGATAAVGLRYRITGRYALEPQMRYTYWNHSDANLRQNEGSFQLGLRF